MPMNAIAPRTASLTSHFARSGVLARIHPNPDRVHLAAENHLNILHHAHPSSAAHCRRVSALAASLARRAGFCESTVEHVGMVGLLHDIGKAAIDIRLLDAPRRLTPWEKTAVDRHGPLGARMLQHDPLLREFAPAVAQHHERWEHGGEHIPLAARITAIVDAWDAMTMPRPYADALDPQAARAELTRCAGTQFDPDLTGVYLAQLAQPMQHTGTLARSA